MKKHLILALRIIVAIILLQTLRFKFTAHPDSVYIFTQAGMEPYGRIFTGILELIAGIMLLIPKTVWSGALIAVGILSGAVFIHLTLIGIDVKGDGGLLFYTAILTLVLSGIILYNFKSQIPFINKYI